MIAPQNVGTRDQDNPAKKHPDILLVAPVEIPIAGDS